MSPIVVHRVGCLYGLDGIAVDSNAVLQRPSTDCQREGQAHHIPRGGRGIDERIQVALDSQIVERYGMIAGPQSGRMTQQQEGRREGACKGRSHAQLAILTHIDHTTGPRIIGIVQVDNQVVGRIPGFEATIVGTSLPVGTQGLVTEHALIAQCIAIGREVDNIDIAVDIPDFRNRIAVDNRRTVRTRHLQRTYAEERSIVPVGELVKQMRLIGQIGSHIVRCIGSACDHRSGTVDRVDDPTRAHNLVALAYSRHMHGSSMFAQLDGM